MIGRMIHQKSTKPIKMWTSAHHGIMRGEPIQDIWFQSSEMALIPRPITVPKSWLTTLFSAGAGPDEYKQAGKRMMGKGKRNTHTRREKAYPGER
jgi:hypothetical protein